VSAAFVPLPTAGKASFKLLSKRLTINLKTRKGSARATCNNVAADLCRFSLTLRVPATRAAAKHKKRTVAVGTVKGTITGGKTGNLKVKLTSKGIKLLRRAHGRKLKVTATGSSKNRQAQATKVSQKLTLAAASPKKRR
jgi:hypothetical protein